MKKTAKSYTHDESAPLAPGTDLIAEALSDAFKRHVGRAPKVPVERVASACDVSESAIYQCMSGEMMPGVVLVLKAAAFLGHDFVNDMLKVCGMAGAHRVGRETLAVLELAAAMTDAAGRILHDSADGIIDHREAARMEGDLRVHAARMLESADQLRSVARRGGSVSVISAAKPEKA